MAFIIGVMVCSVNLVVAFMTDGAWKTAGCGIAQFYWDYVRRKTDTSVLQQTAPAVCLEQQFQTELNLAA